MNKSERLLKIINEIELFRAELLMEGEDCMVTESLRIALDELYWVYRDLAAYDVEP